MVQNHRMHFILQNEYYTELCKLKAELNKDGVEISLSALINQAVGQFLENGEI